MLYLIKGSKQKSILLNKLFNGSSSSFLFDLSNHSPIWNLNQNKMVSKMNIDSNSIEELLDYIKNKFVDNQEREFFIYSNFKLNSQFIFDFIEAYKIKFFDYLMVDIYITVHDDCENDLIITKIV